MDDSQIHHHKERIKSAHINRRRYSNHMDSTFYNTNDDEKELRKKIEYIE